MIQITINKEQYKFPESLGEVPLLKYAEFLDRFSDVDSVTDFNSYAKDFIQFWCGVDNSVLDKCIDGEILDLYYAISKCLTFDKPNDEMVSFEFEGREYELPSPLMKGSSLIEYLQSVQFQNLTAELQNGYYKSLPKVVAILCRPKGEDYNSEIIDERAKLFEQLPTSIAINVGFFLNKLNSILLNYSLAYTASQQLSKLKQG